MTCPKCREAGREVPVTFDRVTYDNRSVEAKLMAKCTECDWTGGPYAL
jgi:hypothetical protein